VLVTYVPLLQVQRDLYWLPRGMERFREYIRTMTDDSGDLALPLTSMNPMAKEHVPELLDRYLALHADDEAATAVSEVQLPPIAGDYRATLVLSDDLKGGWTNRYAVEFSNRFEPRAMLTRGWIVGLLWTSEEPSASTAQTEALTAVFRTAWIAQHGNAITLRDRMDQEGYAMRQAGIDVSLDADELTYTREIIQPLLDSTDMATTIAALFGDAAADSLGFRKHGLSPRAGLQLAVSAVLGSRSPT
jgi:hypothetical protein